MQETKVQKELNGTAGNICRSHVILCHNTRATRAQNLAGNICLSLVILVGCY
jgi:hypothetical protein